MNDEDLLTTTEAARVAGVGPSSVKRWADLNLIPCIRTAGGHRRFRRADLERFLNKNPSEAALAREVTSDTDWLTLFQDASAYELQGQLMSARGRLGAWYPVAADLGRALTELGNRWAHGAITVIEEHIASEKLARAVQRICETLPADQRAPRALLAMAEGDDHTLGLLLAELCLREVGWSIVWSGRRSPVSELAAMIDSGAVQLVALSASLASQDAVALTAQASEVARACRRANVELLLGGSGAWPDHPDYGTRLYDFATLHRLALQLRGSTHP